MPEQASTKHNKAVLLGAGGAKRFKRSTVNRSYSYRYAIGQTVGPADEPLVTAGSAIVSSRYCGRAASWSFSRSMMSTEHYVVNATFVAPSPENPMTYPETPPSAPEPVHAAAPSPEPLPRVPVVPPVLPPPSPDDAPLWTHRPRRADPAPEPSRPEPGAHFHEPPPRIWR